MAINNAAINRNLLAGANPQGLLQPNFGDWHIHLLAIPDNARRFGLQPDEPPDGLGGLATRAHFHGGTEIDQGNNNGGGLKIGMTSKTGNDVRKDGDQHGIKPCRACAQRNQCIHVGVVITKCFPGPGVEMTARIEQHKQRRGTNGKPEQALAGRFHPRHIAKYTSQKQRCANQPGNAGLF